METKFEKGSMKAGVEMITDEHIATTDTTTVEKTKEFEREVDFDSPKGWGEQPKTIEGGEISNLVYTPDWEERRYELAKAAMQGILVNVRDFGCIQEVVRDSIYFADEMVRQFKGE